MDLQIADGVALVTGGGSGIGRAACLALAAEGARVGVVDRDADAAVATADAVTEFGGRAVAVAADVSDEASVRAAVDAVASALGGIDYLVLCAGISGGLGTPVDEITEAEWDRIFAVNVKGQWLPVKAALPHLRRGDRPSVTIVASDSSFVAAPGHLAYCASKGALLMLTRALAVDLQADGVRVNCVCPSVVDTPMVHSDMAVAAGWAGSAGYPVHTPEDIARYLVLLASPVTGTVNGHPLVADFGYLARSGFPA